MFSKNKLN